MIDRLFLDEIARGNQEYGPVYLAHPQKEE